MNYELAKKLKDAGFPQRTCGISEGHACSKTFCDEGCFTMFPTLSELIEACGNKFGGLNHLQGRINTPLGKPIWNAYSFVDITDGTSVPIGTGGDTPEEAVANLWLELQK